MLAPFLLGLQDNKAQPDSPVQLAVLVQQAAPALLETQGQREIQAPKAVRVQQGIPAQLAARALQVTPAQKATPAQAENRRAAPLLSYHRLNGLNRDIASL
ncbi:MAG: hypothetical protein ACNA7G_01085 [Methylobacter sp.]